MTSAKKSGTLLISMAGLKHYEMNKISTRLKILRHAEKFFQSKNKLFYQRNDNSAKFSVYCINALSCVQQESQRCQLLLLVIKWSWLFCNRPSGTTFFISYKSNLKWFFKI